MPAALWVLIARIRGLFRREADRSEFEAELESHLQFATEEGLRRGLPPEDARRHALLALGHPALVRDRIHDRRSIPAIESLTRDGRLAIRSLLRNPGFAAGSVVALGLSAGGCLAVYQIARELLTPRLPFAEPHRLFILGRLGPGGGLGSAVSADRAGRWARQADGLAELALFRTHFWRFALGEGPNREMVNGLLVSPSLFRILGVPCRFGRAFTARDVEAGRTALVVLSDALWRRRFGADPRIVERPVNIDGRAYTVVGVMPPDFRFESPGGVSELWMPLSLTADLPDPGESAFSVAARLREQATPDSIAAVLGPDVTVTPLAEWGAPRWSAAVKAALAAAALVFLAACVTIGSLRLARDAARRRETGLMLALGARPARLVRQSCVEAGMLTTLAIGAGLVFANTLLGASGETLRWLMVAPYRRLDGLRAGGEEFALAGALWLFALVLFAALAALGVHTAAADPRAAAAPRRTLGILAALGVAFAVPVVAGAGWVGASMIRAALTNPGFDPAGVIEFRVGTFPAVPPRDYCSQLDRTAMIPGVNAVSAASQAPSLGRPVSRLVQDGADFLDTPYTVVCPGFFETLRIPFAAGRDFRPSDHGRSPAVAIVDQTLARRLWPGRNPIGRLLRIATPGGPPVSVVGVVRPVRTLGFPFFQTGHVYRPFSQTGWRSLSAFVRTSPHKLDAIGPEVQRALRQTLPGYSMTAPDSLEELARQPQGLQRSLALLLAALGVFVLALTGVGVVGITRLAAERRRREIGIRIALGASPASVISSLMGASLGWCAVGVAVGIVLTLQAARQFQAVLNRVAPLEPGWILFAALTLAAVAALATLGTARRATWLDPAIVLRCD